jgi:hypothetical protein
VDDGVENYSTVLLIQLEEETVEQGVLALDTQKGPGPNGIFPFILKRIGLVVKRPLAVLFNFSLLSGVFPCVWKESYVIPHLFNSEDKKNISNYRGISILSSIPNSIRCDHSDYSSIDL